MRYLFDKGTTNEDGTFTMPAWAVERWNRQMNTPYEDLSEDEKDSDRKEADKFLKVLLDADLPAAKCYRFKLTEKQEKRRKKILEAASIAGYDFAQCDDEDELPKEELWDALSEDLPLNDIVQAFSEGLEEGLCGHIEGLLEAAGSFAETLQKKFRELEEDEKDP